jgi:uncharacterized protein
MKLHRVAAAVLLTISLAAPVMAGPLEDALADTKTFAAAAVAYDRGDYAVVLRIVRPLANRGHDLSQAQLGYMYQRGQGVPLDYSEAAKWYRLAAEAKGGVLGLVDAQVQLGSMYERGRGVPLDYSEAVKWYRLAANRDIKLDKIMHEFGLSDMIPQDYPDQNIVFAQNRLGVMYLTGRGVPQDYIQAHMWFNLSAAQGNKVAMKNRDNVARLMTQAQIAEAQKLARERRTTK